MLANRADTFNLGDILAGKDDLFALSYLENALTSNVVLAPLAARDPEDLYKLVRLVQGEEIPADQLAYPYSALEISEITAVLKHLTRIQQVLLRVNQQYILSASQDDAYRTEPRFQLQGSYRNMNKLAEKVVPVMNEKELESLLDDHYAGEAQTLTTGAEHNLLKLAELRSRMTPKQTERWAEIKRGFARVQLLGSTSDSDPVARVTGQLSLLSERMGDIARHIESAAKDDGRDGLAVALTPFVEALQGNLQALSQTETKRRSAAKKETEADGTLVHHVVEHLSQLGIRLDRIGEILQTAAAARGNGDGNGHPEAVPVSSPPSAPSQDMAPYLERLDRTLATLATAPRGAEIVQSLPPNVMEILGQMVQSAGENLIPLLRNVGRKLKGSELAGDQHIEDMMNRTLKSFDQLKDLAEALRKIDTRRGPS
jgi:hypothetical protein